MSLDLNFWRYKEGAVHDDSRVYEAACCDGEALDILEDLPIGDILAEVARTFPDWTVQDGGRDFEMEGRGAIQITTTPQIVRFDCYGMKGDDMNTLMDVLIGFGCPLYDPQVSTRFDAWTDR